MCSKSPFSRNRSPMINFEKRLCRWINWGGFPTVTLKSQLINHLRHPSTTANCHPFLKSIKFLSWRLLEFLPRIAAWMRIEFQINLRGFNWNLWKFPILFHLDFIVGVYVWCQKINFVDSKSGITQSLGDVEEFHLFIFSPESKCKFHRSVVPPSGARCVSSASLLVRIEKKKISPPASDYFRCKRNPYMSGRLRTVVLVMLLPHQVSPRVRISPRWKSRENLSLGTRKIVESVQVGHYQHQSRERGSRDFLSRKRGGKPFSATPASRQHLGDESSKV